MHIHRRHFTKSSKIITWNATFTDVYTDGISPSAFHREFKNNYLKCHNDRRLYWWINPSAFHREFENNYLKCHNHRRTYRWIYVRRYVVGSILPTNLLTDCANSKGLCITDSVILLTELLTDHEKYRGSLKILVRNSKITDGFLTLHQWNKLK